MELDDERIEKMSGYLLQQRAKRHSGVLTRFKWFLFGMPATEELRERFGNRVFDDAEEERIREIVREETAD